jgi:hypothetical protein
LALREVFDSVAGPHQAGARMKELVMSKGMDQKKDKKKEPQKSLKEKRADKAAKKTK